MKRTQLNLDEKTYYQLVSYARQEKTSISSAARKLISDGAKATLDRKKVNPFLKLAKAGEKYKMKGPADLSTNIDYYLYGEGSLKFGKQLKK